MDLDDVVERLLAGGRVELALLLQRLQKAIASNPSEANFLYLDTKQPSSEIAERFQARGIIIRDCRSFRGAGENHVRVTVGTPSENDRFLSAFMEICE